MLLTFRNNYRFIETTLDLYTEVEIVAETATDLQTDLKKIKTYWFTYKFTGTTNLQRDLHIYDSAADLQYNRFTEILDWKQVEICRVTWYKLNDQKVDFDDLTIDLHLIDY